MDQILGLILLGLGIQSPFMSSNVKGDSTVGMMSTVTSTTSGISNTTITNVGQRRPLGDHPNITAFKSVISDDRANFLQDLEKHR